MEEKSHPVTLAKIFEQGQETKERLITLEAKVDNMTAIHERLDSHKADIQEHSKRLGKLEVQIASQWVIVGLVTTGIGALVAKFFAG